MGQKQGVATTDTKKNGQVENCFFCTWSFANSIIANGNFTSIHIIHDSAVVDWKKKYYAVADTGYVHIKAVYHHNEKMN